MWSEELIGFFKWAIPGHFLFIFVFSEQNIEILPMTRFEPLVSETTTYWATTNSQKGDCQSATLRWKELSAVGSYPMTAFSTKMVTGSTMLVGTKQYAGLTYTSNSQIIFSEISPFWHKFKNLVQILERYLSILQNFDHLLAKMLCCWASFHYIKIICSSVANLINILCS